MMFKRWMTVLIAFALLAGCALAEEEPEAPVMPGSIYVSENFAPEDVRSFIELLFCAAIGTTTEKELELRAEMTDDEIAARNEANAVYRAKALPWLIAAFNPEFPIDEIVETPDDSYTPELWDEINELPIYTTADSYEAFMETEPGREYIELMGSMGADSRETCLLITQEICKIWMAEVDNSELSEMNDDYMCWIYASGTQIDYPVVQAEDNSYYLKRMFNGERNAAGTLFADYRNLPEFQDPNTLIYGHHMRNDSMFGTLTDYAEQAYFEGHPYMLVMTETETFLLELFAGYTTSDKDHCYDIAISDEEDMQVFIEEATEKSDFISGAMVNTTDRLVTLSTCAYVFEDARYIVIGRIVPIWEFLPEDDMETDVY